MVYFECSLPLLDNKEFFFCFCSCEMMSSVSPRGGGSGRQSHAWDSIDIEICIWKNLDHASVLSAFLVSSGRPWSVLRNGSSAKRISAESVERDEWR